MCPAISFTVINDHIYKSVNVFQPLSCPVINSTVKITFFQICNLNFFHCKTLITFFLDAPPLLTCPI